MGIKLFKIESYQKGIAVSTFLNIIAKVILFLNSIIIAYYFGTQLKTDIYFYFITTVGLFAGLISGLNITVIIPESMRLKEQINEEISKHFITFFLYIYALICLFVTIVVILKPVFIFGLISKFTDVALQQHLSLLLMVLPLFSLIIITTFLTDVLASYKYFSMPMIASIINSVFAVSFIIIFHNILDMKSVLLGLITAYILNIIILLTLMKKQLNWSFRYRRVKISQKIQGSLLYSQAGSLAAFFCNMAPIYVLSSFWAGVVTSLSYGQRIAYLPNEIISNQFGSVSGIRFNELIAQKDYKRLNMVFVTSSKFLLFIVVPISALAFLFSTDVISILFQRGKFNASSVKDAALFLKYLVLLLPFFAISNLVSRLYIAAQYLKYSFWIQIVTSVILIILIWIGFRAFGAIGFTYALIAQYTLSTVLTYFVFKKLFNYIKYSKVLLYLLLIFIINIIIGLFIFWIQSYFINPIVRISICTTIFVLIYLILNLTFNINDQINFYLKIIFKRLRKIITLK